MSHSPSVFWMVTRKLLLVMFSLHVEYKKKIKEITRDFVDFALVNYLSVHAYHHFYM